MTSAPRDDDPAFADLLDELLAALLDGEEPDLVSVAERHPEARERVDEAWRLACDVAGRRVTPRPVLGGYEVVRELGRGGMGSVYLAKNEQLGREVAIKVLPHSFGLSAASRQRFLAEARALAQVHHENIVGIHRIVDDGELLAFEMEYVDGPSLQTLLSHLRAVRERTGTMPTLRDVAELLQLDEHALGARSLTQFFVRIGLAVARALGAVHDRGFVHRDVKPANILLRCDGQPVLADFGLVRDTSLQRTSRTGFAGTPVYSSPEQMRGHAPVGSATDVYALAVTLYECLTLTPPFAGRTTTDLLRRIEAGRVQPLRRLAPDAPRDLETIVTRAMELEPHNRYGSGGELADDLERLLELRPIRARPVGLGRRLGKFSRRNRVALLAGCAGALLVLLLVWPLFAHVQAAARAEDAAAAHVRSARQQLLAPACRAFAAGRTRSFAARVVDPSADPLQSAVADYERALALQPANGAARAELAVVRMALWQRDLTVQSREGLAAAIATAEYATLARALPPLAREVARGIASGAALPSDLSARLTQDSERAALGLLGYLLGEPRLVEVAWGAAGVDVGNASLRDAIQGLQLLADGDSEAAFARLRAAHRSFPDVGLELELAEAALAMGEVTRAEQWFGRAADSGARDPRRLRVRADLLAARGDDEAAAALYGELAEDFVHDPTPFFRLAQLAARAGRLEAAAAQLEAILAAWPDEPRFRLARARIALQQRDSARYLWQVLAVLRLDPARLTAGGVARRREILRIGGLLRLLGADLDRAGGRVGTTFLGGEQPLRALLPRERVDRLEDLLPHLAIVLDSLPVRIRGAGIDPLTRRLFGELPLALARLPATAAWLGPARRCACELMPTALWAAYPTFQQLHRQLILTLPGSGWNSVDLVAVAPPVALHPVHEFGSDLRVGADWNGDGTPEVLVGCQAKDPRSAPGHAFVVDGRTAAVLASVERPAGDHLFGYAVQLLGDVDGDDVSDWCVGAPGGVADARDGFVELLSGRDQTVIGRVREPAVAFGVALAALGDVDGDGVPDFAVGVPPIVQNATPQGHVSIYSGRTRERLREQRNDIPGVWFGASLAAVGDVDGDGCADLLVGGNYGGAAGLVRLYSGRAGVALHEWRDASTASGFGAFVYGFGDLDGDDVGDIGVASVSVDGHLADRLAVFSGADGRTLNVFESGRPGSRLGVAAVRYGCGLGPPVLAIGAPLGGNAQTGLVELWSIDGRPLSSLLGAAPAGFFGGRLVSVGDTNGDGRDELFVSRGRGNGGVDRVDSRSLTISR